VGEEGFFLALQDDHVAVVDFVGGLVLVPARGELPPVFAWHGELEEVAGAAHDGARLPGGHGDVERADENLPVLVAEKGKLHRELNPAGTEHNDGFGGISFFKGILNHQNQQ